MIFVRQKNRHTFTIYKMTLFKDHTKSNESGNFPLFQVYSPAGCTLPDRSFYRRHLIQSLPALGKCC